MAEPRKETRGWAEPIRLAVLLLVVTAVSGSRFRYGTISWEPDASKTPSAPEKYWVKFYIRTQFRRSYPWGTAFDEEWAYGAHYTTLTSTSPSLVWHGSEYRNRLERRNAAIPTYRSATCPPGATDEDDLATFNSCFRCPNNVTMTTNVTSVPGFGEHWGCTPVDAFPTAEVPPLSNPRQVADTHNFWVKFPPKMQEKNPKEPVRVCPRPFHCDDRMVLETDADNDGFFDVQVTADPNSVADNGLCDQNKYEDDPGWTLPNSPCAPWQEIYGFYTGATLADRVTVDRNNYAMEVNMKATDYDKCYINGRPTSCNQTGHRNPALADYLSLEGEVSVEYWNNGEQSEPYLAFFTGGDRLYGCAYAQQNPGEFPGFDAGGACSRTTNEYGLPQANGLLRNNAQGRYRLETTVYMMPGTTNKSPVSMMPPLVVLQSRPLGTPVRFRIPAYDPEDDAIVFRMGNHREYGGVVRSKLDAFPYENIYIRLNALNQTGNGTSGEIGYDVDPSSPTRGMMKPFARTDAAAPQRQLGNFGCNFYDISVLESGVCSSDRLATAPMGSAVTPTGTVEWHAWFRGDKSCILPSETGCSRLPTGLYNFVVMIEEAGQAGTGKIKVPVDFLAYLYDGSVSFCGDSCNNVPIPVGGPSPNVGLPTFVDRDGVYGSEIDFQAGKSLRQSCTICAFDGATTPCNASGLITPSLCTCNVNTAPRFYQDPTKQHNGIPETPLLTEWQVYAATGGPEMPYLTYYLGETVEFYVSAYDQDDCAEVYIDATGLPFGDGAQSTLSEPIYEAEYPEDISVEYPRGAFVRKKFTWSANLMAGQSLLEDTRPSTSVACFTASDKYLYHTDGTSSGTLQPYCIEIRLIAPPPQTEQALFRWDWDQNGRCSSPKLAISWHPMLLRYVFVDQGVRYFTTCKFEQYMWHHVFATIGEDRMARLYVDGELQELMKEVGQDPTMPDFDQGIPVGTEVEVIAYVNKCIQPEQAAPHWWTCGTFSNPHCPGTLHARADRRRLSSIYDERVLSGNLSITSDFPVSDGFLFNYNASSGFVEEAGLEAPTGECCGFRMGMECAGESNSFDGFIDEVVVFNRQVDEEDIKSIMFKMPQYLPARELEAPRGVQQDLSAGRVFWARFNNPCMEGPIPEESTAETPPVQGGRRRLQQMTDPAHVVYGLPSTDAFNNTGRRLGVSDKAGMTSGGAYTDPSGTTLLKLQDSDSDRTNFIGFRSSSRYAYTGVPWLAPTISRIEVDRTLVSTANPLPLDGGLEVTLSGVGFARSPWLKCVSAQPDIRSEYEVEVLEAADKYQARTITDPGVYDNFFKSLSRKEIMIESMPWMYEKMDGVLLQKAETLLEPDEWSPYLLASSKKHPQNKGMTAYDPQCTVPRFDPAVRCPMNDELGWHNAPSCAYCPDRDAVRLDWHPSSLRNSKKPPYEQISQRLVLSLREETAKYEYKLYDDFIYGGWEKVTCIVPAAAFPSDHYYLGVSNDGGITGSPATSDSAEAVTFTEYALELDGKQYVEVRGDVAKGRTFSMWFMPKDLKGFQNLMNMTAGVGVAMREGELLVFNSNGQMEYPADGETGVTVTAGEWHNFALVMSGTSGSTLKFYVDGRRVLNDGTIVLDGGSSRLVAVGDGFRGYLDEVKVFVPAMDNMTGGVSQMNQVMWDREKPNPDPNNLKLYMRFNAPSQTMKDGKQQGLMDSSGNFVQTACMPARSTCKFLPVPAPWEPISMYEINEDGPGLFSFPMTGGAPLQVKGFNFAPSQWLSCGWSRDLVEVYSRTYDATANVEPTDICPYSVGSLNSVLGRPAQLPPYSVYKFNPDTTVFTNATIAAFSSWADDYESTMELACTTPLVAPDVYHMSVSGEKFLNVFPFEITDVSLYCNGEDVHLTAPAKSVAPIATSSQGYTFSAWVMPFAIPEANGTMPRNMASDKLGHRRAYLPEEKPEQTIFAMENPSGGDVKHAGALMYDGVRFFYYDDCILDVTSTTAKGSRPNEWHYVAVRIDKDGEGDLFVDGIMVEHFTTVCKPQPDSSFSICMDEDRNGEPSAFFHGLVDEVKVITQSLDDENLLRYMFNQRAHQELSRNLMYFTFDSCSAVNGTSVITSAVLTGEFGSTLGPNLTMPGNACGDGDLLVPSSGPWRPARLMAQDILEGGVTGFHKMRVVGANLGVSQWLGVTFNGTFSPALEMDGPNVMIVDSPPVAGATVVVERLSNWAGAASLNTLLPDISEDDTVQVKLTGSVQDLGTGLEAYYTFDAAPTHHAIEVGEGVTIPDADAIFDFAGHNRHGAVEAGQQVPDRDGYESGAILIDGDDVAVAYLPPPATYMDATAYTVCVWLHMSYSPMQAATSLPRSFAHLYGAWKMYSMVRYPDGGFDVYINSEATSDETVKAVLQQAIDNFLETGIVMYGLPAAAAMDDMWVYSRALSPSEVRARYYTNAIAVDFGKPALDWGFGAPKPTTVADPMSPDYAPGLQWPVKDPLSLGELLGATGPGMSMMAKMMALGMAAKKDRGMESIAPVIITNLTVPSSPTFTAWIYPWEAQDGPATILADSESKWALGVDGQRLYFYMYSDCPCEPCSQYREVVSWMARVLPGRWTHVAAKYDAMETGVDGNVITLYVDGVLVDKQAFTEYGTVPIASSTTASVGSDMDGSQRFNGLVYSVGVHQEFVPWQIKREVQCPQRAPEDFVLYLGGSKAASFGNRTSFVMGVAPKAMDAVLLGQLPASSYVNATYDDPTVAEAVTITGPDHLFKYGGYEGDYIITTRTACGKKRVYGGDGIQVSMAYIKDDPAEPDVNTSGMVSVQDFQDGNYHVAYSGLPCGVYETKVKLGDGSNVTIFNTTIAPGPTSPTDSLLLTKQTSICLGEFGVVHTLQIQAKDAAGCNQTSGTDVITVRISGPADMVVTAHHVEDGLYEAKFVPPAYGKYFVEIKLTNAEFTDPVDFTKTPYLCINICNGHSIRFDGVGSVETSENVTAHMDAVSDTGEITMEAWVSPLSPSEKDSYVFFKGTVQEAEDDDAALAGGTSLIKGYSLRISRDLQYLTGSVYIGLGEYRTLQLQMNFQPGVWVHVAVTYNGTVMKGYQNGSLVDETAPSEELRPMHHNLYGHPLNVGYRLNGRIDEPAIWRRALEPDEIAAKMWCPKFLDMDDIVVYMPFNEKPGSTDLAAFSGPAMSGMAPFYPYMAPAVVNATNGGYDLESGTPYDNTTRGVGIPGNAYSKISPGAEIIAGDFDSIVLNLQAFDQCAYHYIGQGGGDFKLQLTRYKNEHYTDLDPQSDGVPMYPIELVETPMELVDARGLPGTCYDRAPAPPYYRGDLFEVVGEADKAGTYYAQVTTRSGEVLAESLKVKVVARLGNQSEVLFKDIPDTEAGVEAAIRFNLTDGFDNTIYDDHSDDLLISIYQTASEVVVDTVMGPFYDELTGEYLVPFLAGSPVEHTIVITIMPIKNTTSVKFRKTRPTWRRLLTSNEEAASGVRRFEAGGATDPKTGDLFIWGGASHDKSYLDDVWALRGVDPAAKDVEKQRVVLAYRRVITITAAGRVDQNTAVEITVNTAELVAAGKLHHKCNDIYFTMPGNGDYLSHYVDTFKDHACGTATTIIYLMVPGGLLSGAGATLDVEMYYGSPGHYWPNPNSKPSEVFAFYEGFEDGTSGAFVPVEPCSQEPDEDNTGFEVERFEESYSGAYALHAKVGARAVLRAMANQTLDAFTLRAWFWDSNAHEAAHFVSPDYSGCGTTAGNDFLLPEGGPLNARSTAVGAYTLSHTTKYCVSSPWQSSGLSDLRSAQWHRLDITSTPETGLSVSIDGRVIKSADPITLNKVLISTGYSADGVGHEFLANAHAYFDEISVVNLQMCGRNRCLSASLARTEVGVVKYVSEMGWEKVEVAGGTAPPARYGHSSVVYAGGMLVFGGERSSYAFNDVWWFSFEDEAWTYLPPKSHVAPSPRFDHVASVTDGVMFIHGGQTAAGKTLSDAWMFDIETREWIQLAETTAMGARFGHASAFGPSGEYLYIYGGYAADAANIGFSNQLFRCSMSQGNILTCEDITDGCREVAVPSGGRTKGVGLTPRSGHSMVATAAGMVVTGGSDESTLEPVGAFAFDEGTCSWSLLNLAQGDLQGSSRAIENIARHDHVAMGLKLWMAVLGGVSEGGFVDSVYVLSIP